MDTDLLVKVAVPSREVIDDLLSLIGEATWTGRGNRAIKSAAAILVARELPDQAICEALHLHPKSLALMHKNTEFRRIVQAVRTKIKDNPQIMLDMLVPSAFSALERAVTCKDNKIELQAAEAILDRRYGKAVQRQLSIQNRNYNFNIVDRTHGTGYIEQDRHASMKELDVHDYRDVEE